MNVADSGGVSDPIYLCVSPLSIDRSKMHSKGAETGREMRNFYIVIVQEYYKHRVAQGSKSRQVEMSERERDPGHIALYATSMTVHPSIKMAKLKRRKEDGMDRRGFLPEKRITRKRGTMR